MTDETAPSRPPTSRRLRCGFAALAGRPNVGKSTLLNALLGQKVSIVSPKPQTTRTRIHGVLNRPGMQITFVDLPGIHAKQTRAMNRYMNRTAISSLADVDLNLFVVEALRWTDEDERVLAALKQAGLPIVLLINKVDRAHPRERLLPYIEQLSQKAEFVGDRADLRDAQRERSTSCRRSSRGTCRSSRASSRKSRSPIRPITSWPPS